MVEYSQAEDRPSGTLVKMRNQNPTIAIAVDGMEKSLVESWGSEVLPNLHSLMASGCHGALAVDSLSSAQQWTSHFTGVGPEIHGISGFVKQGEQRAEGQAPDVEQLINTNDIQCITYPEILANNSISVALINPLPFWPPLRLSNGICIAGLLTPPDSRHWTHPKDLGDELREMGYRIDIRYGNRPYGFVDDGVFAEVSLDVLRNDLMEVLDKRIVFTKRTIESGDFHYLYSLFKSIDVIQHCFWTHMEREDPQFRDMIHNSYQKIDQFIGWVLDNTEANLVIFSDHGFKSQFNSVSDKIATLLSPYLPSTSQIREIYNRIRSAEQRIRTDTHQQSERAQKITGVHGSPAMYVLSGPDIRQVNQSREIHFQDLPPTIMSLLGESIPAAWKGTPPREILETPIKYSDIDLRAPKSTRSEANFTVQSRLYNLGYADMVDEN